MVSQPIDMASLPPDIQREILAIRQATREICKDKQTALAYLIKHGFVTPDGKLADRYK